MDTDAFDRLVRLFSTPGTRRSGVARFARDRRNHSALGTAVAKTTRRRTRKNRGQAHREAP